MSYKEEAIRNAEFVINAKRKRRSVLEGELIECQQEENEARAVLQLLKTGKVSARKVMANHDDYMTAIKTNPEAFTKDSIADLIGATPQSASQKLRKLELDGIIAVKYARGTGYPTTVYEMTHP